MVYPPVLFLQKQAGKGEGGGVTQPSDQFDHPQLWTMSTRLDRHGLDHGSKQPVLGPEDKHTCDAFFGELLPSAMGCGSNIIFSL